MSAFPQDNPILPTGRLSQSWQRYLQDIQSQVKDVVEYTPGVGSSSGTITTAGGFARYQQIGKQVILHAEITVTDNGTGSGAILVDLPSRALWGLYLSAGSGYQDVGGATPGKTLQVALGSPFHVPPSTVLYPSVAVRNYDGTYPSAFATMYLNIVYEVA